jgi:aminoglycoside 3-N-acetyltransferase I
MGRTVRTLGPRDAELFRAMLALFGEVFDDVRADTGQQPSTDYLEKLLSRDHFIAVAALDEAAIVGGLTAYVLDKYKQEHSEMYIYDLAVAAASRRQGVALALIDELRAVARARGAHVIFVQADYGDDAAVALYEKIGSRKDVMHFDIAP